MIAAARKAARSLKRDFGEVEKLQVSLKGPANFVTAADRRAEEILRAELAKARPGYGFLGEEGGRHEGTDKTHTWIVDPLDGTTNFLHGIPQFAISIGLERAGTIVAGVIYNPVDRRAVHRRARQGRLPQRPAAAGRGAQAHDRCDGRLRRCRITAAATSSSASRSLPRSRTRSPGLRRFGAAALDLAYVAAGRFDGYWERNLSPWDMAAGLMMVREAGGFVTDLDGGDAMFAKGHIVAGNETMHRELLTVLKAAARTEPRSTSTHRRALCAAMTAISQFDFAGSVPY